MPCVKGMNRKPCIDQGHRYVWRDGRKIAEHRATLEDKLGRRLSPDEVVHHIDHDPLNNEPDNLIAMSRAEHLVHHLREMDVEPWTPEEEQAAIELKTQGCTIAEIAGMLGKTY